MSTCERPRVGVAVIMEKDGKMLFGLRCGDHAPDLWGFPGGKMEMWEHPFDAAKRELAEETGMTLLAAEHAGWANEPWTEEGRHYVTVFVRALDWRGNPEVTEPDKMKEWTWLSPNHLNVAVLMPGIREWLQYQKFPVHVWRDL